MRLATFNVENMFERPKVMNLETWDLGAQVLEDFHRLNNLIQNDIYTDEIKKELLEIMQRYPGLINNQESTYIRLRIIRGKLIAKPKNQPPVIAVSGRNEWIGWFELEKEEIKEAATENTARIIDLINPDVLCVVEAENRILLKRFNDIVMPNVHASPFAHVMLIDGNDARGIDVGIMAKNLYEIISINSHIDDQDNKGIIFSRDCAEYEIRTTQGNSILVLVNHFKSKGYGNSFDSNAKRLRQAARVRNIYEQRLADGFEHIAVVGDLNAAPDEEAMAPLTQENSTLKDVMVHPKFLGDGRPGTHGNGTKSAKLDYILMSPKLFEKVEKADIERRGVWGGKNGTLFPHLPDILEAKDAASDHAALWVDLNI